MGWKEDWRAVLDRVSRKMYGKSYKSLSGSQGISVRAEATRLVKNTERRQKARKKSKRVFPF